MGLFDSFSISASALTAERLRMDVTAENLANAQTTRTAAGGPYQRKDVLLEQAPGAGATFGSQLAAAIGGGSVMGGGGVPGGVEVAGVVSDPRPPRMVYDPGHPDADKQGYVAMPDIDTVTEMVDLITEQRSYEANTTALQASKQMFSKTLDLLR